MLTLITTTWDGAWHTVTWQLGGLGGQMSSTKLLVVALAACMGLYSLLSAALTWRRGQTSRGWPSTTGKIIWVEIKRSAGGDDDDDPTYTPVIDYEYVVNGQTYRSQRIVWGDVSSTNRTQVANLITEHTPEATVTVYYNPADPSIAVLNPVRRTELKRTLFMGALWLIVALAALLSGLR